MKPRRRWRHSLRLRLIAAFVLLALAMTAVFVGGMQRAFSIGWREAARPLLEDYVDRFAAEIGSPPDLARAQALTARLPISIRIEGPRVNWDSHPGHRARRFGPPRGEAQWWVRTTADGHRLHFGLATLPWQREPHAIGWFTLLALLGLTGIAYAYLRRQLKPLDDIREGADRFGRGAFDQPIPLRRHDELGDLAQRINTMAREIEGMLEAKRALLLAVSHELRSPLTRARLNAELLPDTPDGAAERAALLRDLNEMRDLISSLLESERLAASHGTLHREPVDLAALIRDVVRETAAGLPQAAAVALDLAEGLPPQPLDRARIRLLLRNLLDNALRYGAGAPQPPRITLRAGEGGDAIALQVRDFGPGVEEAQLERLTEPFYRTDSARARTTGGVGLGMYLCRLVVQAHGGRLELRNAHPGLQIDVRLP